MAGSIHIERRFHALSFFLLNLANPKLGKGMATKASTWYDYVISLFPSMNNWWKGVYISYRRGLTGVAYPPRKAMREPKRWDKQEQIPPRLLVCIYMNKHIAEYGNLSAIHPQYSYDSYRFTHQTENGRTSKNSYLAIQTTVMQQNKCI